MFPYLPIGIPPKRELIDKSSTFHTLRVGEGLGVLNPSNAEATFVQSTKTQRFLKTI